MSVDSTGNSSNWTSNALDTSKLSFEADIYKNPLNITSGVLGASSYSPFIDNTNIATNSIFIDNSSSNFVGDLSKPCDDTFIYAHKGVVFNGAPTLSSLPGALIIGSDAVVTDKLTGIQYLKIKQPLTIETPAYDELLAPALIKVPSTTEIVFNPSQHPLNTSRDLTDAIKSNDRELSIVNVVGGGLNLPHKSQLRNLVITVENGDINVNGDSHELNNVTLVAKNGNVNLSGVRASDLSVFASGSINLNQTAIFSGKNLLATKNGSVIFSEKTVTEKPEDSINVFTNGNISINTGLDVRANFFTSGSFTINGASKIIGSIKAQGDIIFNASVQMIADNVISPNQPAIAIIDTGIASNNPDFDYRRLVGVKDYIDNDNNPFLSQGEGSEHGTYVAGIIGATQNNDIGIDGINNKAPIFIARVIGSGKWAQALIDSVDAAKQSGQPNVVVNLALDLTQINNADGTVTTRYEFTPDERIALEYVHQKGAVVVVAAGNDGGVMSALGQSSQEFDNVITVGAANGLGRADYSSYGHGLNILAPGGTIENPILSTVGNSVGTMAGTSVATAYVTGAASRIWGENPNLSYRQVIEILEDSATDLAEPGWDMETGSGLLNIEAAVELAKNTTPQAYNVAPVEQVRDWSGEGEVIAGERAVNRAYIVRSGDTLWDIAATYLGSPYRWTEITKQNGSRFTEDEARRIQPNQTVYLPLSSNTTNNGGSNFGGGNLNINLGRILNVVPSSIRSYAQNSIPLIIAEAQRSGITDPAQIAYILATAQQESLLGKYMYELASGDAYEGRRDLGNTQPGDGRRYKGRGFVQITGRNNYANWSRRLGIDLINNPDLAADPVIAAKILVQGMRDGSFTGVGLGKYISGGRQDFYNARRIVNGIDKASYIATLATNFWSILRSGTITNTPASNLPTTGYRNYYVRPGDTPSGIALREMGGAARWREILKADSNPLSDWDTRNLQVGQLLRLPFGYQLGTGKPVIPSLPSPNPNGSRSTIGIPVNLNSSFYTKNNPFWLSGYGGPNCTWYANGRLKELGYRASALDKMLGNAHQWDDQARKAGITVTNKVQVGAIAVWEPNRGGSGRLGHVAVVEQINPDGSLLISESSWLGKMYNTRTISGNKLPDHFVIIPRDSVPENIGNSPSINVQPVNSIIFFPRLPTINMSDNETKIYSLRHDIKKAANEFGIPADLLGSIILDELNRKNRIDDIQDSLARLSPKVVYDNDYSIGIAQMKPKTALSIFENYLGFCPPLETLINSLMDDSQACRLVAAWIAYTIKEWSVKDSYISKKHDILATLYSRGYSNSEIKSNPQPSDRGTAIANNMQRMNSVLNYNHNLQQINNSANNNYI